MIDKSMMKLLKRELYDFNKNIYILIIKIIKMYAYIWFYEIIAN